MRPPRYQFPNEVREAARTIAVRMVREGTIARTPEELDAWISRAPDVRESLEHGGYGQQFTSHDLFPLFQVFVEKAGGPAPEPDAPPPSSPKKWVWIAAGVLALVVLLFLIAAAVRAG